MPASQIAKQMIEFQKTTFDNTYNSMVMLQDHAEKLANTLFEQATWVPQESSRAVNQWIEIFKKGRSDFKIAIDDIFCKMEGLLADEEKIRS